MKIESNCNRLGKFSSTLICSQSTIVHVEDDTSDTVQVPIKHDFEFRPHQD